MQYNNNNNEGSNEVIRINGSAFIRNVLRHSRPISSRVEEASAAETIDSGSNPH